MFLSYDAINDMAQQIVNRYRKTLKHPRTDVDIVELLKQECDLNFEFYSLSNDASILGLFSPFPTDIPVWCDGTPTTIRTDGKTALIDASLLPKKMRGRRNFTIAHEGSHVILNHCSPEPWVAHRDAVVEYVVSDWEEWQANTLASCLLMPEDSVRFFFKSFYNAEHIDTISYLQNKLFHPLELMAEHFGVSKKALSIRLKKLELVDEVIFSTNLSIIKEG